MIFAGVDIATMSVRKSAVNFKAIGSAGDLMTDANVQSRASAKDISHLEGRKLEGVQSSWLDAGGGEELGTGNFVPRPLNPNFNPHLTINANALQLLSSSPFLHFLYFLH